MRQEEHDDYCDPCDKCKLRALDADSALEFSEEVCRRLEHKVYYLERALHAAGGCIRCWGTGHVITPEGRADCPCGSVKRT